MKSSVNIIEESKYSFSWTRINDLHHGKVEVVSSSPAECNIIQIINKENINLIFHVCLNTKISINLKIFLQDC